MFNTIDLFAGAGGLSLGFMQTKKYDIKVAYEFNPAMQETYKKIIQEWMCLAMLEMRIIPRLEKNMERLML